MRIFKISSNFKEANKKIILVLGLESFWKTLETISVYTESNIKKFRPSKKYSFHGTVPLKRASFTWYED